MPASYIAPGVYNQEIDASLFAPQISTTILGLVGGFKKGPIDEVTFVSSRTQFVQNFGTPLRGDVGFAAHAAMYFLRWGNQLKVVRVGDSSAAKSTVNIIGADDAAGSDSDTDPDVIGSIDATSEGTWADGIKIVISSMSVPSETDNSDNETIYTLEVYDDNADTTTDAPLEVYNNVVFDDTDDPNHVGKIINGNSLFVEVNMLENANPTFVSDTYY